MMLKAMTEQVAELTRSSQGRAVTLETCVNGEFVSISVAARDGEEGTNAQAGRVNYKALKGRKADGPNVPGAGGGSTGGGEVKTESGGKRKR